MSQIKVKPSIWKDDDGTYTVRVATTYRGTRTVRLSGLATQRAAEMRVAEAATIRARRDDVRVVWEGAGLLRPHGTTKAVAAQHRTVAALAAKDHALRTARMNASNPALSGLNGGGGLRPRTVSSEQGLVSSLIVGPFGSNIGAKLSLSEVDGWIIGLAERGVNRSTQQKALRLLRRIIGQVGQRHLPDGYPWGSVRPIEPARPMRRLPDPSKWGGAPGDKVPALPFPKAVELAAAMRSAGRIVIYLMVFMGLRRGEVMGLQLRDFTYRHGRLWMSIERQVDLRDGTIHSYLKTRASRRRLPLPRFLQTYVVSYVQRRFGVDLTAGRSRSQAALVVTSTGRDRDGSYMSCTPNAWAVWFRLATRDANLSFDDIGYEMRAHHLRSTFATYMILAPAILDGVDVAQFPGVLPGTSAATRGRATSASDGAAPDDDDLLHAGTIGALLTGIRDLIADPAPPVDGPALAAWVGHEYTAAWAELLPPTRMMLRYSSRQLLPDDNDDLSIRERSFLQITEIIERLAESCGLGQLVDVDDEHDSALILHEGLGPDGRPWMLLDDARAYTGTSTGTLVNAAKRGQVRGALVYAADANREAPGRRLAFDRASLDQLILRNTSLSASGVERATHLGRRSIPRLVNAGLLTPDALGNDARTFFHRSQVTEVLERLLHGVREVLDDRALAPLTIRTRVISAAHHEPLRTLLPQPAKLHLSQVR